MRGEAVAAPGCGLFQVGSHDLDEVFGDFARRFFFPSHVMADVVLDQLAHERAHSAGCG
jgi:hypothetical protein